jgi:eukaryotic-like serine/threonine-protein kinase
MNPATPKSFVYRLQQSKLLNKDQVSAALAAVGPDEPGLSRHLVEQGLLTRFQARQLRIGGKGFFVDKYVVVDFIGRGGQSVVYKARHTLLTNRYVALKTLTMGSVHHNEETLARFRREVDIVAGLDHPNIVRAYDVIQRRHEVFLVLEYVDGCDLARLVSRFGPLPVADAAGYALQAAQGLAYAHRSGIVHRDVKPANLLLARDGVLKLADLGLAQFLATNSADNRVGKATILGTPEFMAPEQAENADHVDARSDLYSLGATLYHLLTADLPVKGGSYLHRLQRLLTLPPRPLAEARREAPTALAALVDRLRARDPRTRPDSAEEVIALLQPFARKANPDHDPQRWDGRRKAALVLEVLQGRLSPAEACLPYGLPVEEFERWRQRFLEGAAHALDPSAALVQQETIQALYAKIGAQAVEIESLKDR